MLESFVVELEAPPGTRDGGWRALDVGLVVASGCGGPRLARRARRMLLHRLLASLVRYAPRLVAEAAAAAPKLMKLAIAVRFHLLVPPSPPPAVGLSICRTTVVMLVRKPVTVSLTVRSPSAAPVAASLALGTAERWDALRDSEGAACTAAEARLLLQV